MKTPVFDKVTADFHDAEASFMLRGKIETYKTVIEALRALKKPSKQVLDFIVELEAELKTLGVKNG